MTRRNQLSTAPSGVGERERLLLIQTKKLEEQVRALSEKIARQGKSEAALAGAGMSLADIIDFLPDVTFAVDTAGKVILWNRAAEELTGAKAKDMLGQGNQAYAIPFYGERRPLLIGLILQHAAEEEILQLYRNVRMKNGVVSGETTFKSAEGCDTNVLAMAAPLYDSEGKLVGAIESVRDVTAHKRLEEQLRQSQKMEAVGMLAGGVAHDFNNILTAIIGYAALLKLRLGEDNPLLGYMDDILTASERAANLTRSLLSFSRRQQISIKPEHLNEIVRRVEKLLRRVIGEDIEFKTTLSDQDLVVMVDCGQLEQVLMNLAANSRDAMPNGGTLTIGTDRVDIGLEVSEQVLEPGAYAAISVADTGQGMCEVTKQRIFDPFFTTKEVGKGTGLGLSIVYGIIKQHNGDIEVCSEPGCGTTFNIYLKLVTAEAEGAEKTEPAPVAGGTETILVAEDDAATREILKQILEEYGYTVIEAVDGEDAVAKFASNKDRIQLVILDVVMPNKNATAAYAEMQEVKKDVPVLFTSGYSADTIVSKMMLPPGPPFISKPITPYLLLSKVREVLSTKP